jgi:hypothetical protein
MTQVRRFAWLVMLVADAGLLAWGVSEAGGFTSGSSSRAS